MRAVGEEDRERRGPRHVPDRGEPGGRADQVLLGNTHLEEPIRVGLGELVRLGRVGQIPVQHDRARIGVGRARRASLPIRHASPSWRSSVLRAARVCRSWSGNRAARSHRDPAPAGPSRSPPADGTMLCQVCTPSARDKPLPLTVCAMMHRRPVGEVPGPGQLVRVGDLVVVVPVDLDHPPTEGLEHRGQVDTEPGIASITTVGTGGLRSTKAARTAAAHYGPRSRSD